MRRSSRSGWSLIEALVAVSVLAVVVVKGGMVFSLMDSTAQDQPGNLILEDKANQVVERIALAIIGSDREALFPQFEAPVHTSSVRYNVSLGIQNGVVVWAPPEEIGLQDTGEVTWRRDPGMPAELRVVWTNLARPFLEGEQVNGVDDNGNGLIDEQGLSFVLVRNSVTIRLSLGRTNENGDQVEHTVETTITVRNRPE